MFLEWPNDWTRIEGFVCQQALRPTRDATSGNRCLSTAALTRLWLMMLGVTISSSCRAQNSVQVPKPK